LRRGRTRVREGAFAAAIAAGAVIGAIIALPVLAPGDLGPVLAVNGDAGETIGWPRFARTVADVYRSLPHPRRAVILTGNCGEAGAIDRYGPALGLPHAHSGHNAYGDWGPPPDGGAPIIVVGLDPDVLAARLRDCSAAARIDDRVGVDNEEQGEPVMVCRGPRRPWSRQWPLLRHLD
jgi:hypothetical protein